MGKIFVQFFNEVNTTWCPLTKKIIPCETKYMEGCGSDSVAWLDARKTMPNLIEDCKGICKVRKFAAFQICRSIYIYSKYTPLTPVLVIEKEQGVIHG